MKRTSKQMYPIIESYLASGQDQNSFCRQAGISKSALNYWLGKYRREQKHPIASFVEIIPEPASEARIELSYPSGVELRFDGLVAPAYLRELLGQRP